MTETRDFDRLARAWLDLMPDEAPDRVIDTVLQAVDRTAQRRPSIHTAIRRFFEMNRLTYAAIALAIVVLGGGAILLTQFRPTNVGPAASTAPSPTAAEQSLAGPPADLRDDWLGAHHDVGQLGANAGTHLRFTASGLVVTASNEQPITLFSSAAAMTPDGKLQLTGSGNGTGTPCSSGAIGTYELSMSGSKETLTLTKVSEDCVARSNAVAGTWWRDDCKQGPCYGNIDPGTYGTEYFLPGMQSADAWVPTFGALQFTTTGAWSVAADAPTHVILVPQTQFKKWTADGGPEGDPLELFVFTQPRILRDPASCPAIPEVDAAKGHSVPELLTYLRSVRGLTVNSADPVTIDGHPGTAVDVRLKPSSTVSCWGSGPSEEFLVTPFGEDFAWYTFGLQGDQRTRLILFDLGPDSVVGIAISASASNWDAMLRDATPIFESFHFE
jgi:hypothetical protein